MDEWLIVASDKDRKTAAKAFEDWKIQNNEWFKRLNIEDEVIIDTILTADKTCITQYRVKVK